MVQRHSVDCWSAGSHGSPVLLHLHRSPDPGQSSTTTGVASCQPSSGQADPQLLPAEPRQRLNLDPARTTAAGPVVAADPRNSIQVDVDRAAGLEPPDIDHLNSAGRSRDQALARLKRLFGGCRVAAGLCLLQPAGTHQCDYQLLTKDSAAIPAVRRVLRRRSGTGTLLPNPLLPQNCRGSAVHESPRCWRDSVLYGELRHGEPERSDGQ